jgi:uncharacterized protein involved in exopolysaccharide biosynthesis
VNRDSHGEAALEEGIDLVVLGRVIQRYKLVILACTLLGVAAAVAFVLTATPMYRAEVTITEVHDSSLGNSNAIAGQLSGLASLAGVTLGAAAGQNRDAQALLKSRRLAEQFIQRYQLIDVLLAESRAPHTLWYAQTFFRKKVLNIDEDRRNGVTTVSVYWSDPKLAARWANDYVALSNELIRNRAAAEAQRNIEFLKDQLKQVSSVEVQHAMYNLVENETKTLMLAQGRPEFAFSAIDPAVTPEQRASPKTVIVVPVGLVGGLFAGMLIGIARYKLVQYRQRRPLTA